MSLREKLILKDGKARPPAVLRKVCCHNGSPALEERFRGDIAFDIDFVVGRQMEVYSCIQCGYSIDAQIVMRLYQAYMLGETKLVVGRNIKQE